MTEFASESIQVSTYTKSETKLGMAHLNSASFPTIMLSGRMLISYLWTVTEIKNLHFVFYIDRDEKLSYSLTLQYPVHIKIPKVTKAQ